MCMFYLVVIEEKRIFYVVLIHKIAACCVIVGLSVQAAQTQFVQAHMMHVHSAGFMNGMS